MVKLSKVRSKVYMATPIDVVVFKCHKICPTENSNLWNRALFTWREKNFGRLSNCRYADCAQNLPGRAQTMCSQCSRFHPNRFTFREL